MNPSNIEERLWEYIDEISPSKERAEIELLLQTNAEWKKKYEELLQLHHMIAGIELEQPSMRFTQNVMEEIAKYQIAPATKSYINKRIIYGIATFFIIMLAGLLIYTFGNIHWNNSVSSAPAVPVNLDKINWNRLVNNSYTNIFMLVNVVLGLMLLDRYLGSRKASQNANTQ